MTQTPFVPQWAHMDHQTSQWFTALANLTYLVGLWYVAHVACTWSWRVSLGLALAAQVAVGALVDFMTIYNVVRCQWLNLVALVVVAVPQAIVNVTPCTAFIELAQDGKEGITYGMLTTMANVAWAFTPFLAKFISDGFRDDANSAVDSPDHRQSIGLPLVVGYTCSLLAIGLLMLLPKQKDHVEFLKAYGGKQPVFATLTLILCFGSVLWAIVISILSVFPATVCLSVGGGTSC
ncbi:Aste57867_6849 [Aphanomyces stellatus]|nr:hypothetical protein As57867_006828 [Aphanomyces stellatus]VFT83810.1 Aste57867_6849 [Aphanomyces stellatus]